MPNVREEAVKRIEKKKVEIAALEMQIREANSYIQALEDMLKLLPRDNVVSAENSAQTLRPGSIVARARDAILVAGKPLHINEILTALGKPSDNTTRAGVSGSISAYYRRGDVFTRPAPNTFGLVDMEDRSVDQKPKPKHVGTRMPPENFGSDLGHLEQTEEESNDLEP